MWRADHSIRRRMPSGGFRIAREIVMPGVRAVVFENPVAPNADPVRLRAALDEYLGPGAYRIITTTGEDDFPEQVDEALIDAAKEGCDLAIAVGGDGTVALVARSIHRLRGKAGAMVLGMVPCGTANILARELDIPPKIGDAVAVAVTRPRVLPLDGIGIGDRLFLTQVGIGLDAQMIHHTSREAQQRFKRWSYLVTLARRASGHRSQRFRLHVDGKLIRVTAFEVLIANASTLGARPFVWGPDIDPTDGVLDLCIYHVQRGRDVVALAWMMLTGRHAESAHARFLHARNEVRIESQRPLLVQGDGESLGPTPVQLRVIKEAVRVAAPLDRAEAQSSAAVDSKAVAEASDAKVTAVVAAAVAATGGPELVPPVAAARRRWWERARKRIGAADTAGYLAINGLNGGTFVDRGMALSSRLLDWGEFWAIAALLAALSDRHRLGALPLVVLPPLWVAMLTVNFPIKSMFRRKRPFLAHDRARLVGRRPKDTSFPSGHTAAAFIGATLLSAHLPGFAPFLYAYATVVGFSRVYLGMHFPADVVVGSVTGVGLAMLYGWLWTLALESMNALHLWA